MGLGPLVALEGSMTADKYMDLLDDILVPELHAASRPMVFMQDNAPCYRQNASRSYLLKKPLMSWIGPSNRLI